MALVDYDPNKHGQAVSGLKDYVGFTAQDAEAAKDDSALTRGFKNSFRSARMAWNDFTNDRDELAQLAAEDADYKAIQAAKQTKARKELGEAWDKGDGITGGLANVGSKFADDWKKKGFVGVLQNIDGMTDALLEQAPNAVIPLATTAAGAVATGGVGAIGGAALGNTAMEYGEQFNKAAQAAGVDVHDKEALDKFIRTGSGGALGKAALKGSTIGVVDALTAGAGGKILNAGAKAAEKAVLKEMGIDLANKGFASAVKRSPEFAVKVAEKSLAEAGQKGFGNAARHAGAFALEPVGEFAGEYLGSGIANNEWDAKGAALEAFASLGQSAVQFVGTKAYAVATDPLRASKAQIKDALQESQSKLAENVNAGKLTTEEAQAIQLGVQAAIDSGIEQGGKGLDTAHSEQREQSFDQFKDRLGNQEADEVFRTAGQSPVQQNNAPSQAQEYDAAGNGSEQIDDASQSDIELLGGDSKVDGLTESREPAPADEAAANTVQQAAVPDIKPSERMGLNANDGALSAAAVIAVDSAAQKPTATANAVAANTPSTATQSVEAQNSNIVNQESENNDSQIQPTSSAEERVLPTGGARTGSTGRASGQTASSGGSARVTPLPTAYYFNNLDAAARKALAKNAGFNINAADSFETLGRRVQRKIETDYHARINADHQAAASVQEGRLSPPVRMADAAPIAKFNFSRPADALNKQNRMQFDKLPADIQHHAERVADYTADGIMRQEAGMPDMRSNYPKSVMESAKAVQAYRASNPDSTAVLDSLNRSVYGYRRNNGWNEPLLSRDGEDVANTSGNQTIGMRQAEPSVTTSIVGNVPQQAANAQADNAVPAVPDTASSVEQAKNQPDLRTEQTTEQPVPISKAENLAKVDDGVAAPAAVSRPDTVLPVLNPQAVELAANRLPAAQAEVFRKSAAGIADFVREYNRMPSENAADKAERNLAKRAKTVNEVLASAKQNENLETRQSVAAENDSSQVKDNNSQKHIDEIKARLSDALGGLAGRVNVVSVLESMPQHAKKLITGRVEGWFNGRTGSITLAAENLTPERAVWVAWHELGHRGFARASWAKYSDTLKSLDKNLIVRKIADAIQKDRAGLDDKAAGVRAVAIEEALVELYAAERTGNWAELAERYNVAGLSSVNGVAEDNAVIKSAKAAIKRFADAIRRSLARLLRKEYSAKVEAMSDKEVLNLLSDLHELNMKDDSAKAANDDSKKFSFAGQKAYTADVGKFSEAERLEKDGKSDKEIWEQTGWFKGKDGKWRFEIDDSQAELSINKEDADKRAADTGFNAFMANVEDFLKHDPLFVAYPEIRKLAVFYDNRPMANGQPLRGAAYQAETQTITLGGGLSQDEMKSSLLHEIQHHIQRIEGYAKGGSPKLFEKADRDIRKDGFSEEAKEMYKRLAGEVEARNVQFRREMGIAERGKSYPRATEDIMDDLQNVMFSRAANVRMESIISSVTGNASDLKEAIRDKWDASKGAQLQLLGRRQITDIYGDSLDGLKEYERLSELFGADSNMAMVEADKVVKQWGKLKKDDAKQLADLMHDATLAKVDADPKRKDAVTKRLNAIRTALDIADNKIEKSKAIIAAANPIIARAESAYNRAEKVARKAEAALLAAEEKAGREILADEKDERLRKLFYINSEAKRALGHANAEWMKAVNDKSEAVKTLKESRADIKRLEKEEVEAQEAITKSVELNRRFNRLSEQAKEVYRKARDDYKAHFEKVRDAVAERMERAGQNDAIIQRLKERFDNELGGVYFPLARFGDYLVVVKDADGKNVNVSRAETLSEAEKIRSALKADFKEGFTVSNVMKSKDYIQSRDAVSNGFMKELNDAIGVMDLDPSQQAELNDTLTQLYLNSLPDTSWAKHGIHRKGVAGFSDDARRAYAQNMSSGASYLSKLRYADRMAEQLDVMQDFIEAHKYDEGFEQRQLQRVADEMRKRHDAVMNPTPSKMAQALTGFGFLWMMGMSPASAIVNLSQTAMIAYPVMASKWGYANAARELLKASKQISTGFKGRKFNSEKFNTIEDSLNDDEKAAFKKAVDYGVIDLSQAHDLAGVANGEQSKLGTAWQKVMDKASWMFHHAEKFNRQVTFVAAYRLAKQAGADSNTAFEQAKKATYDGHFDYSSQNRPRFMMGNVAKVVFLFKQYSQNILYALGRNAYLSFKGDKEARKTLAGILVTHAMASGVLGLPFVTTMLAIASALGSDDDDPWDAEAALRNTLSDTFGDAAGEVMAKGFSRLTPLDVSGRLGLNQLIFPDIQDGLDGKKWAESLVVGSTGAVVGAGINAADGMQKMVDGRYLEGLEGMLPAAIRNPLKAIRYGLDGQVDKSGIVIKDDFDPFELAGQAIGFRSSDLALKQEGKSAIYQRDRSLSAARTKILSAMAKAVMDNDLSAMEKLRDVIVQWNSKNPDRPIRIENIKTSVRNRQRRISGAEDGIYIPESRRAAREAGNFAFDEE